MSLADELAFLADDLLRAFFDLLLFYWFVSLGDFVLHFYLGDGGGFNGENLLDTDVVGGDASDDERLQAGVTADGNDQALKDLSAGFVTFCESLVDTYGVADGEIDVFPAKLVCHIRDILAECG